MGGRHWRTAALRALRLAAKPVRRAQGRGGLVLEPYRGYGSREAIFLIGRVFRQSHPDRAPGDDGLRTHLRDIARRIARRSLPGAAVTARFGGAEVRVETDRDGYFRVHLHPVTLPPGDAGWHAVDLVLEVEPPVRAVGQVFVPPGIAGCVVVSDIDDTVMRTGVANKAKMLWRLFVEDAGSRVAFPGVAALYRALYVGPDGTQANPMLYVSRAPWGLYEMLSAFFTIHGIPVGPVLFLREWGLSWKSPLPRRAEDHKRALIAHMLALYSDRPFVLIGDSGQHDPEVYGRIVAENPGRVRAVYIRNVSREVARIAEIERLADAVAAAGSRLVIAADSTAIAVHAAGLGLIAPEAVARVAAERAAEGEPRPAEAAVAAPEDLGAVLGGGEAGTPPSVVLDVEPARGTAGP
ncbi:App1 family protein [uncultured Methylobacterium sp.]|uniref:App1 family protein n=1 Tax=uncultured Methylobacterium sp. TaxID=157278 RepID=UPI0035CC754D